MYIYLHQAEDNLFVSPYYTSRHLLIIYLTTIIHPSSINPLLLHFIPKSRKLDNMLESVEIKKVLHYNQNILNNQLDIKTLPIIDILIFFFFFFLLIDPCFVSPNSSCHRFLGRPLLLFPAGLFIKIFLRIRSSLILSTCAYQFSLSSRFDPVINLLDFTFFPDVLTSLFVKQRYVKNSSKGFHLSRFQHLPSFGLYLALFRLRTSVLALSWFYIYVPWLLFFKNLFDQTALLRQPEIVRALIDCVFTSVSRS